MTPAARLALAVPSTILFALALALTACGKADKATVPGHNDVVAFAAPAHGGGAD
jgi:hypothetical protein